MAKKSALGKGLSALISNEITQDATDIPVSIENYEIAINKIKANPTQPRTSFEQNALNELANSIRVHGIIQPITLREIEDGYYQIISGERRFRAAQIAGLNSVPAYIRTANDYETLEMALIENIQREDLDAIEIAITYNRLMNECDLTQEALSERVGKKRSTVTNYLRLLALEDEVQQAVKAKQISMGHAKALAGITNTNSQKKLAKRIIDEGLSVRQIEDIIKKLTQEKNPKPETKVEELPNRFCTLVELLEGKFNNKITIKRNQQGEGSITISYSSDDEIELFIKNLSN